MSSSPYPQPPLTEVSAKAPIQAHQLTLQPPPSETHLKLEKREKNKPGLYHKDTYEREKEAKNKLCASRAWHDWADWSRPDLTQTALLSEIRAKMMCWKAGDPWAFLNHQVPLSQHTRRHPRQTGGSCFNRGLHPIHYRRKVICRFYSLQTREAENVWEIERLFFNKLGDPYLK